MGSSSGVGLAGDGQPGRRATEPNLVLDGSGEGSGEQVLWGAAEGAGAAQSGEEEAEGATSSLSAAP